MNPARWAANQLRLRVIPITDTNKGAGDTSLSKTKRCKRLT